jgi:hypothetical protein
MRAREMRDDREIDWFFKEVRGTEALTGVPVVIIGERREHDCRRPLVDHSSDGKDLQPAVPISAKTDVGDDQVDGDGREERGLGLFQRSGRGDGHVIAREKIDEGFSDGDLVFDDQDMFVHEAMQRRGSCLDRTFANVFIGNALRDRPVHTPMEKRPTTGLSVITV